jgi:hypothetical protein
MESKLLSLKEDANDPNDPPRFRDLEEPDWEGEVMKSKILGLKEAANKPDEPGWKDRLSMWDSHDAGVLEEDDLKADIDLSSSGALIDNEDDNEDYVISQFPEAWKFLIEGEAYQWLLGKIRAQLVLNETGTVMETIRTKILQALSSHKEGGACRQTIYKANFEVAWCPATFIQDQFPEEPDIRLGAVLVLTGSGVDAQATTCAQYMHQTWPTTGAELLLALKHMVANELTELYRMYR